MNINAKTTICGIIGYPVDYSLSPAMHNAAYATLGLNFAYLAFPAKEIISAIRGIRALSIRGVSVTLPHKKDAIRFVDKAETLARKIGAINTIVNDNTKLTGYNTDCEGAVRAMEEVMPLYRKSAIVLGAGGAANAIVHGLAKKGMYVLIISRNEDEARVLAKRTKTGYGSVADLAEIRYTDFLINATSVGMKPLQEKSLVPATLLHKNLTVFDIVYAPKETQLLKDAKTAGCKIIFGYKMLLYQAVRQFELFTGKKAPLAVMEKALLKGLSN